VALALITAVPQAVQLQQLMELTLMDASVIMTTSVIQALA